MIQGAKSLGIDTVAPVCTALDDRADSSGECCAESVFLTGFETLLKFTALARNFVLGQCVDDTYSRLGYSHSSSCHQTADQHW